MSNPTQITASAARMPSMRTTISSFDRSEPEAALGGGAAVAAGAVMAWLIRRKCHSGAAERSPGSINADEAELPGPYELPFIPTVADMDPGLAPRRAPE